MKLKRSVLLNIFMICCLVLAACSGPVNDVPLTLPETTSQELSSEEDSEETESQPAEAEVRASEETTEETGILLNGDQADEVRPVVEETLREYALFFIYMGFDLESHLDPSSPLHDYLFGSDTFSRMYNEYYNYEYIEDYSFSEFETSDYTMYGDEYLTVNVRYRLDIIFSRPDMKDDDQHLDALWTFRNTSDGWKLLHSANNGQSVMEKDSGDPGVSIYSLTGADYDGVLIVLDDASRLICGTVPEFAYDYGQTVPEMISRYEDLGYNILGGINGGNFDDGGTGSSFTAMPLGVVISEGSAVFSQYGHDTYYHMTGFTEDGLLIIDDLNLNDALETGIRDAVYTTEEDGPFLIRDGAILYDQLTDPSVYGAGKNPRTAIGQRADGSVMLLVINGRQPASLGATFEELANIMLDLGAVTASAMDGGTSSQMIWKGEILNHPFSAFGLRMCPTAWLIKDH